MALVRNTAVKARSAPEGKPSLVTTREAEAQREKARTLAKQQQAAKRIAAAKGELASGIAQASSAAEELKRASDRLQPGPNRLEAQRRSLWRHSSRWAWPLLASCRTPISVALKGRSADADRSHQC